MEVDGAMVARELRRRRLGRPALLATLDRATRSTWLPGDMHDVPTSLLVLAAMSLTTTRTVAGATPTPG